MIIDIGVHGMEILHATLGPGAESVTCLRTSEDLYYSLDAWGTAGRAYFNTKMEDLETMRAGVCLVFLCVPLWLCGFIPLAAAPSRAWLAGWSPAAVG
ncbi:MAG: hypothetical protein EXR62_09035 [Chloroflexi bacterium]|nr:hypothetical protein [Chloroflexota bacterium]